MSHDERFCQKFLRAASKKVRTAGLVRGTRYDTTGAVCMLGAMDYCGVCIPFDERSRIEAHLASLLPIRPDGPDGDDRYNVRKPGSPMHHIAWWSNMRAKDAEEVAQKLELAAESC